MASWTEWEFKGEFLNVAKVSELGLASSPDDEVSSPAVLQLPCECDGVSCAAAVLAHAGAAARRWQPVRVLV